MRLEKYIRKHRRIPLFITAAFFCIGLAAWQYHSFKQTFHHNYQLVLGQHSQEHLIEQNILKQYQQAERLTNSISQAITDGRLTPSNSKRYLSQLASSGLSVNQVDIQYQNDLKPSGDTQNGKSYRLQQAADGQWNVAQNHVPFKPHHATAQTEQNGYWKSTFNPQQSTLSAQYQYPISYQTQQHKQHAVVSVTIMLLNLHAIKPTWRQQEKGLMWLSDGNNLIIAHPDPDQVSQDQIDHYEQYIAKDNIDHNLGHLLQHQKRLFNYRHLYQDNTYHMQSYDMGQSKLFIGYKINPWSILELSHKVKKPLIKSILWAALALLFVAITLMSAITKKAHRNISIKTFCCLFFILAGAWVLYIHDESDLPYRSNMHQIDDPLALQSFAQAHLKNTTLIPTGIEVTHIANLKSEHTYNIKALLWQTVAYDATVDDTPNVTFMNNIKLLNSNKIAEQVNGKHRKSIWELVLNIQHSDDMTRYPFDETLLTLKMLPKTFTQPVQLVPDLAGYQTEGKQRLLGIYKSATMTDQRIQSSFFSFDKNPLTNKIKPFTHDHMTPYALSFNMELSRISTQTFFTYFIPLLVVLLLTYTCLMVLDQRINSNIDNKLTYASGIIVVLTLIHIRYHDEYDTNLFTYMDALLTYLYFLVLLVLASIVVYSKFATESRYIRTASRWLKASFWPLSSSIFLAITMLFFL